ncbi:muconolactone Delta-isomerase [Crenobacter sp. SG2305]|uniref:muconolactone Delta-isomerase n=1 Tax=Crenobacter oryzisoli TaxID=3056844 RepID=UPI0025AAB56C|nr:muconolactone Delta-isomerase [Crenobacter sp. SG2305]MDN0082052.1 muconolactone Delta-isomerase [Crenobacter sp. SG2305]MDN0084727.1 muconolactone Delta-isomerase [Crenobacter sp. SG2305]MDN0084974.1 muconolactone Delta-isomerase [Crenobacter sp. SG2305]MDN0085652.1 muconolactone Delta-isomerase [Crenobacter sp. SG2305]
MLFHVRMDVNLPPAMPEAEAAELKRVERDKAQALQASGKWRHLWRIAGQYSNISLFDVDSVDELHTMISTLPLFPYMTIQVMPLCRHPSSIRDDDK